MKLRETLTSLLSQHPSASQVKRAALLFHQIATVHLRYKVCGGSLRTGHVGLTIEDIAMDCIAPLFQRDRHDRFRALHVYFDSVKWEQLSEEVLLSHTRRLVFSSVNQGLARLWKQMDPSLEKLLRNLAAAIRTSGRLEVVAQMGHKHVLLKSRDQSDRQIEEMSQEYLEAMLAGYIREGVSMRAVVDAVAEILAEQDVYAKDFPLIRMAIAIRTVFARSTLPLAEPEAGVDGQLLAREISSTIRCSVSRIHAKMEGTYVGRGKTDIQTYSNYFEVIGQLLLARYAECNGEGLSLFSCLAERTPGLTIEDYRDQHRAVLEYLFKLSEREFLASMKTEL